MAFGGSKFAGGKFAQAGTTTAPPPAQPSSGTIADYARYTGTIADRSGK